MWHALYVSWQLSCVCLYCDRSYVYHDRFCMYHNRSCDRSLYHDRSDVCYDKSCVYRDRSDVYQGHGWGGVEVSWHAVQHPKCGRPRVSPVHLQVPPHHPRQPGRIHPPRPQLQVHSVTNSRVKVIPSPSATGILSYTQQGQGHTLALSYRYTQLHTTGLRSYPRPQLQVHSVIQNRVEVIPSPSATGTLSYTKQGWGHTLGLSYRYTQLHIAGSRSYPRLQLHSVTTNRAEVIHSPSATGTLSYTQQGRGHTLALSYRYTELHTAGSRSYSRPQLHVHWVTQQGRGHTLALSYRYTQLHTAGSRSYPRPQLQVHSYTQQGEVIPSPSAIGTLSYTQQGRGHTLALSYRYTQLHTAGSRSYPRPQLQVHSVTHSRVEVIPSPSATGTLSYTQQGRGHTLALSYRYTHLHTAGSRSYPRPQLQVHSVTHSRVEVIPSPSATGTLSYTQQGRGHTLALSYRYTQLHTAESRSYPRPQLQVHSVTHSRVEVIPSPSATGTLSYTQQGRGHTLALSYRYTQLHTAGSRSYPRPQLQVH